MKGGVAGLLGPWIYQVCRDVGCLSCRSYGTIRVCFYLLAAGIQRVSLAGSFLFIGPFKHLKGPSGWIFSAACCVRHLKGHSLQGLGWSTVSIGVWRGGYSNGSSPCI